MVLPYPCAVSQSNSRQEPRPTSAPCLGRAADAADASIPVSARSALAPTVTGESHRAPQCQEWWSLPAIVRPPALSAPLGCPPPCPGFALVLAPSLSPSACAL